MPDAEFAGRLRRLAGRIEDNWSLCEFAGKAEREYMVAETIHAAVRNLDAHGEPFSFRGDGVFAVHGNGLVDNAGSYRWLLDAGYFEEAQRQGRAVIFPTARLLDALERFFAGTEGA